MSETIHIERFTRQEKSISGRYAPAQLDRLADYLAGEDGEIRYTFSGSEATDPAGGQKRRVKCIISGWFLVLDPDTYKPVRHDLNIESRLVVVRDESELPPLELESTDEDYVICTTEMNVMERVEEEILLDLPSSLIRGGGESGKAVKSATSVKPDASALGSATSARVSPFARLVELKKK